MGKRRTIGKRARFADVMRSVRRLGLPPLSFRSLLAEQCGLSPVRF